MALVEVEMDEEEEKGVVADVGGTVHAEDWRYSCAADLWRHRPQ